MKKYLFILALIIPVFVNNAWAQREINPEDNKFMDRVYFGGNFNLQFGNVTFIDVSPLVGYMVTDKFSTGVGVTYQYLNYKFLDYQSNIYGGRVFGRHNIGQQFFALTEIESLNVEFPKLFPTGERVWVREWVPGVFVGGGIFQPFGRRGGVNLSALYNLTYERGKSPYANPWVIRAGISL